MEVPVTVMLARVVKDVSPNWVVHDDVISLGVSFTTSEKDVGVLKEMALEKLKAAVELREEFYVTQVLIYGDPTLKLPDLFPGGAK